MTSGEHRDERSDETLELPGLLRLAVGRGWLPGQEARDITRAATTTDADVLDLVLAGELLSHQQIDILLHLSEPRGLVPGYEIVDVLGQGAMGVVYKARQLALERNVALKTIRIARLDDPQAIRRARAEAVTVARLSHQNIAAAYDQGVHDGRLYLAIEFVEGENWDDRISREGPMDERLVWGIARQVAAGLAHAEERGVVHRDVKPANVLLASAPPGADLPDGVPLAKITDFGIALGPRVDEGTRLTQAGTGIGTPDYVAPEQLLNSDVDARADIYSLGASVCHALLGERLFGQETAAHVMRRKVRGDETWRRFPLDVGRETVALVESMTRHDPGERIGSHAELIAAIDALLANSSDGAVPLPVPPAVSRSHRRVRPWPAAVVLLSIALLAVVVVGVWIGVPMMFSPAVPARATNLERTGRMAYLFDGESAPIGRQRGQWEPTLDSLGGTRLSGSDGWIAFAIPPEFREAEALQIRFGLDLGAARSIELHFPVDANTPEDGERHVLRISSNQIRVGTRAAMDGDDTRADAAVAWSKGEADYTSIQLLWQSNAWFVDVDATEVGGFAALVEAPPAAILVRVQDGTAHLEGIAIVELESDEPGTLGYNSK